MADERERRQLLAATDHLLDHIEELRLADRVRLPERLRDQVEAVAARMGARSRPGALATVAAAHDKVLHLQTRLLRSSGRASAPRRRVRSEHAPRLSLPERVSAESDPEWLERVRLTVQRARDRASYLAAQVETAKSLPFANDDLVERRRTQAVQAQQALTELMADARRITGQVPRLDPPPVLPESGRFELGDLVIEQDRGTVLHRGRPVLLTLVERRILVALAVNDGRVVTREALQHLATAADPLLDVRSRSLDVHLVHLRDKLGDGYVENVLGIGYRSPSRLSRPAPASETELPQRERRAERDEQVRRSAARSTEPPLQQGNRDGRPSGR